MLRQRVVDLFEQQPRWGKSLGEVAAHARLLRPLAGKHKGSFHARRLPLHRRIGHKPVINGVKPMPMVSDYWHIRRLSRSVS